MKNTKALVLFFMLSILGISLYAQTNVGGTITSNTIWTEDNSPYIVIDNIIINENVTLSVEPGVEVRFNSGFSLLVNGMFAVIGSPDNNIRLTSNQAEPNPGDWGYVKFNDSSADAIFDNQGNYIDGSILKYCIIEFAGSTSNLLGSVYLDMALPFITNCIFQNNALSGLFIETGLTPYTVKNNSFINNSHERGGGIWCSAFQYALVTIEDSFFYGNHGGEYAGVLWVGHADATLKNNLFVSNNVSGQGMIRMGRGSLTLLNNSFIDNMQQNSIIYIDDPQGREQVISNNLFIGNEATQTMYLFPRYNGDVSITYNQLNNYLGDYEIYNRGAGDMNAENNFWGADASGSQIQQRIYDWYDDQTRGLVYFDPFLTNNPITAPITLPQNVFKQSVENSIKVSWQQNSESDLAGYKIYYNPINEYTYANSVDVGNQTEYEIPGLSITDEVVITAYDIDADGVDDQLHGNESWYSKPAQEHFTFNLISGGSYCNGEQIDIEVYVIAPYVSGNSFIIQLSDINGSFDDAIELAEIDTTNSFVISVSVPDTLTFGTPYLIRVKSSNPEVISEHQTITYFQLPTSSFELNAQQLCGSMSVTISYTGNATQNASYDWDFDGGNIISGSGQGDYEVNWNFAGNKSISLTVSENGCNSDIFSLFLPVYDPDSDFSMDNVVCENMNTSIEFTGFASDSASYIWDFDYANIISGSGAGPYVVNWNELGSKNVSLIIDDNGCISSTTLKIIDHNPIPTPTITAPENVCFNGLTNINYTGSASSGASYNWFFNNGIVVSGSGPGPYVVYWNTAGFKSISLEVEENGCSSDTLFNLQVLPQTQPNPICMVTVDSINRNMIIWEQPINHPYDSIVIYKESSQAGNYSRIGVQAASEQSTFTDSLSNPSQNSNRYKLAVIDTCGFETPMSTFHKTMHLTISAGLDSTWNLIWDKYEGFDYLTFNIYRGTSDNNFVRIAEMASNTFAFTDLTPPIGTLYYQIEAINPNPCFVDSKKSTNDYYNSTLSNIVSSQETASITKLQIENIKVWPNPATELLYIHSDCMVKKVDLSLISHDGRVVLTRQIHYGDSHIDISSIKAGVYILRLNVGNEMANKKLIIM